MSMLNLNKTGGKISCWLNPFKIGAFNCLVGLLLLMPLAVNAQTGNCDYVAGNVTVTANDVATTNYQTVFFYDANGDGLFDGFMAGTISGSDASATFDLSGTTEGNHTFYVVNYLARPPRRRLSMPWSALRL